MVIRHYPRWVMRVIVYSALGISAVYAYLYFSVWRMEGSETLGIQFLTFRPRSGNREDQLADWMNSNRSFQAGDKEEALRYLRRAAEGGLVSAQFDLARGYANGQWGKTDLPLAAQWYRKAAANGHPEARTILINLLLDRKVPAESSNELVLLTRQAASGNDRGSLYWVNTFLTGRNGFPRDEKLVYETYKRVAESFPEPQLWTVLGMMSLGGVGTDKNEPEGLAWLSSATARGYTPAEVLLGDHSLHKRDFEKALKYYRYASTVGNPQAVRLYKILLDWQTGGENLTFLFQENKFVAEERGDSTALVVLGDCYAMGFGVPVNVLEAERYFQLAASRADPSGSAQIAFLSERLRMDFQALESRYRTAVEQLVRMD